MTTIVGNHYDNIPYTGFATFKITGPLSNHQFPHFVKGPVDNKIMTGHHMNPSKFNPSDSSALFAQGRVIYSNSTNMNMQTGRNGGLRVQNDVVRSRAYPRHNPHAQLQCKKYIAPKTTSMYIYAKKNAAIGQSSITKNNMTPFSFATISRNDARSALGRLRRHGGAAPPKAYAIENKFKGTSYWGAEARQGLFA